ncbi:aromatic ring-hydroxylating oxygenase subunit alpha [Rhizobium oryzicola]|uniref:Aromatic ring-hydroxylating dioxygenase subunit alpha n=1 Tax=Rhizobium oryzicola TaxID=1232668 RepID=A0ABT8SY01_9HYPH|nr:aromatic ring-hydroxylating dioxygenase subunit alpha [Rhizobium oryzicola]MDO1583226.1 aromatic ring-hydroxylating dioxygenase subunit alpha [Rhizobium oryzicola]
MQYASKLGEILASRKKNHALPRDLYISREAYEFDLSEIFEKNWLMIGLDCELPKPGSYLAMTIGQTPVVVIRGRDNVIRGFFNSCRHRGAQICADGAGRSARLVCPYHQWTYELDGKLIHANSMPEDFDPSSHALQSFHVRVVAGAIYICLASQPPEFDAFAGCLEPMLAPMGLESAKLAHTEIYVEKANWKLVMENGRECYHCAACHPELGISFPIAITPDFSAEDAARSNAYREKMARLGLSVGPADGSWWQIARFPLNDGVCSMSLDGKIVVSKPLCNLDPDMGSLRIATEPHNFIHVLGDYAFVFSCYPTGPEETVVIAKWYVHKDAVEGVDYDPKRLIETWDATNRQDRDLAENNHRGVRGIGYQPGPYSQEAEALVIRFVDWYCDRASAALGLPALQIADVA